MTGEVLELVQCIRRLEGFCIELDRGVGSVDPGAAAGRLLGSRRMRRAVRTQEKLGIAARCSGNEGLAMCLPLQYRQTVVVGPDAALEHGVTIV